MKNTLKILLFTFAVLGMTMTAHAQSQPVNTTTSAAILGGAANNQFPLTAVTNITASTTSLNALTQTGGQQLCLVDHEIVGVAAVNTTSKVLTVRRALGGSATPHASGSVVICGPGGGIFNVNTGNTAGLFLGTTYPSGGCTEANNQYLPVIAYDKPYDTWRLMNCNSGTWTAQTMVGDLGARTARFCAPNFVGTLTMLTSFGDAVDPIVMGTALTPVAGSVYYTTIDVPQSFIATGLSQLNGTVAATDKFALALYRADGTLYTNTPVAGTTSAGVGTFQDIAFASTAIVTGPSRYWVGLQVNGTTARPRVVPLTPGSSTAGLGAWTGLLGSSFTGTFGTFTNLIGGGAATAASAPVTTALPTTLIASTGPVMCLY